MSDDEAAQKARAERLRQQIERLKSPVPEERDLDTPKSPAKESPRDFTHRRMRELDQQERPTD
jgi:hypothetical protein